MLKNDNFFTKLSQIEPSEIKGALVSFSFIFVLMASYMIMKPVRDALPSDWGDVSLAQQWTYTFIVSTIAVFVYNLCASFVSLRILVPSVFVFFAASFLGIYAAFQGKVIEVTTLGKIFYVWSSVSRCFISPYSGVSFPSTTIKNRANASSALSTQAPVRGRYLALR